jgi:glycolate oxidase FAD binding subunit
VQGSATVFKRGAEGGLGAAHISTQALQALAPPLDQLHRQIKAAFDPAGIFNPGRLYADL